MLKLLLDTILPGDDLLGLPAASRVCFNQSRDKNIPEDIVENFVVILQAVSLKKYDKLFDLLEYPERLKAIYNCQAADIGVFTEFLTHLFRIYYSDEGVLTSISVGAIPPFPGGNVLDSANWDLLESVYDRGVIFRKC